MKELERIILALVKDKKFLEMYFKGDKDDVLWRHFGLGLYIRNKFLWRDEKLREALLAHYNTEDVDYVSERILLCVDYFVQEYPEITGKPFS